MFSLEGNLVIVDHGMGLNSAFLHLATVAVRAGQAVRQGQLIGTVGATGRATGPALHWSLKWNGARLDPLLLAGPMLGAWRRRSTRIPILSFTLAPQDPSTARYTSLSRPA